MKIAILDPFDFDRLGYCLMIRAIDNIEILIETRNSITYLEYVKQNADQIDFCVIEINLNEQKNGFELMKMLKAEFPRLKFILLAEQNYVKNLAKAIKAGVNLFIYKSIRKEHFKSFFEALLLDKNYSNINQDISIVPKLNDHELRLAQTLSKNLSIVEVASELKMEISTLIKETKLLKEKLSVRTRLSLMLYTNTYLINKN